MMFRRRSFVAVTITALMLLLFVSVAASAPYETEVVSPKMFTATNAKGNNTVVRDEAVSGQVIARLRVGATEEQLQGLLDDTGTTLKKVIPNTSLVVIGLPEGMSVTDGVAMLSGRSPLAIVEPDRMRYPLVTPDDPLYDNQYQWPLIAAEEGWDVQTGATETVVAIIDTGYDPDHEDLVSKYWQNQAEAAGQDDVDDDGNGYVDDVYGWDFHEGDNGPDARPGPDEPYFPGKVSHGTHVGGLVGAASNNATGVAGHDWSCQLMMVRVFGPLFGAPDSIILQGFQYAVNNGADIINMSLGGYYSEAWNAPITDAFNQGIVVVCSAGNSSVVFTDNQDTWFSPVCNDGPNLGQDNHVLGVAATDRNDLAADFTNRDGSSYNFVDVSAPGVNVLSTWYHDPGLPGHEMAYEAISGTSMSCPIVSGLAALVRAEYPSFTPDAVIEQIRESTDDISSQNPLIYETLGTGRINSASALGLDIPPDPVSNLQARDTVGDEGGSITVSWRLPPQDDQDVIGYNLMRAEESQDTQGEPGDFTLLAQLEPGTQSYMDTPVPDDTPFWYQVITLDESNQVPAEEPAGPARARDDLAPEPVDNLVAVDTQADDGGAITLSWVGYEPAEDLVEYRVYRATEDMTDVSEMDPLTVIPSGGSLHYVDRDDVEDGTEYWYAVTGVDDFDNEETEVTPAGPVVSNPNFAFNYPAGLSMISVGALPGESEMRGIDDILGLSADGDADLAYWDPGLDGGQYVVWSQSPGSNVFRHELGKSWWLRSPQPLAVNVSGEPAAVEEFEKQVVSGWNQVGNPFPNAIDFSATQVTGIGQGTPVSLETSNQLGYTRDYAWAYDTRTNSYRLISGADLPFASTMLKTGRGVLFLTRRPATLLLQQGTQATANAGEQTAEFDGWALRLVAEAEDMADTDNFLGVASHPEDLSGIVSPPRPDADLDLYFADTAADGGRAATDFVAREEAQEWQVRVACALPGTTVRLSWPDLSNLPDDVRPTLVDNETGRAIYLRTSTGYTYEVGDEPAERSFTIRLADEGAGTLAIGTLTTAATEGRAQIMYTLSQDASVDVEVLNIAGVTVRRVVTDRAQEAGPRQVTWDGRNTSGTKAPAGRYIIRIRARTDDGQQVSAIRSLQLER